MRYALLFRQAKSEDPRMAIDKLKENDALLVRQAKSEDPRRRNLYMYMSAPCC